MASPYSAQPSTSRIQKFKQSRFLGSSPTDPSPVEKSSFSPDTPNYPEVTTSPTKVLSPSTVLSSIFARTHSESRPATVSTTPEPVIRYVDPSPMQQDSKSRLKAAFGRLLRTPQSPILPTISAPLESFENGRTFFEKRNLESERVRNLRARRKQRNILIGLILIFVVIVVVVIVLVIRLRPRQLSSNQPEDATPGRDLLTEDQAKCLQDFKTIAPDQAKEYFNCLPILQSISDDFRRQNPSDADIVTAATEFCALRAIYEGSNQDVQSALDGAGWFQDAKFCTWQGVTCNGTGRIGTLEFTSATAPNSLPAEIAILAGLSSLRITGGGDRPTGKLPTLPSALNTLELSNTALDGPLEDATFSGLANLKSLILVGNTRLGSLLPAGIMSIPLQSLSVQGQNLAMPLDAIFGSQAFAQSLQSLNLSQNLLTGALPDMGAFQALRSLDLSSNSLVQISARITIPGSLVNFSLSDNASLAGSLPDSLCSSTVLQTCSLQGTSFSRASQAPDCGVCQF